MTVQKEFWDWFLRHEAVLFTLDPAHETEREEIFDQVAARLGKVDPDLAFELGPKEPKREFVISASGMRRAFPSVTSLADAAPRLDRWRVVAFRPRRPLLCVVRLQGLEVDVKDVQFSLLVNGTTVGIYLFIPGYRDDDVDLRRIGYLLLDEALGEFDVESRVGLIRMFPTGSHEQGDRHPLVELPTLFDQLVANLEAALEKHHDESWVSHR
jgi:hypothetical protein